MVDVGIVFQKMLMLLVMMSIGFFAGKTRVMSVESNHMLSLLTEPMQSVGQISTPGAMMLVGSTLSTVPVKGILRNWRLPALTVVKLVIAPVIARLLLGLFVRNAEMLGIVTLTVAMPSGSISSLLAAQYEKDEDLAAEAIFLTTICSVATIPLMVLLL